MMKIIYATIILLLSILTVDKDKTYEIKITVEGMHCPACAANLQQELSKVTNVKNVTVDLNNGTALVYPVAPKKLPPPKLLWETIEKLDFTPKKIIGPQGSYVYTKKPK